MSGYTKSISWRLASLLKEKGMPIDTEGENIYCPPFAEVLDWLSSKGVIVSVVPIFYPRNDTRQAALYGWASHVGGIMHECSSQIWEWELLASHAIERAVEMMDPPR